MHSVFADTWYEGKGLKQGDYFRYSVCFTDWHNCTPIELDFWIQNKTSDDSGYNVQFLAIDGSNIQKGHTVFGMITPDPEHSDPNIADYTYVYKSTINLLGNIATSESPMDFNSPTWYHHGIVGNGVGPMSQEQVTVQAGTYNAWIIGWHKGVDNKIWVVPNLPFPIKAATYIDCACGKPPPLFTFELLEMKNSPYSPINQTSTEPAHSALPEFGSLAGMIIVLSIIGVVLISRKFNYRVM